MALARAVTLDDKYTLERGDTYVTGMQALVQMLLAQRRRDARAGLRTAGYVSGYRGSPLGGLDQAIWQARTFTEQHDIVFRPGVNEELAATAIWGTQQANAMEGAKFDGVFALWYGKGPGVDRSGDAFKHGNFAGTSPHGGVLLVAGDDHTAKSSTLPHQSDYAFISAGIPMLAPAGVAEFAEFGVLGWAMSRFSGCWVGFKAVAAVTEASAALDAGRAHDLPIVLPEFAMPPGGVHIRSPDDWNEQEARLFRFKLPAAQTFARANGLDRIVFPGGETPQLGILTSGKSFLDVMEALDRLGMDAEAAARAGLRLYKPGLAWPLEPAGLREFAAGLAEILVIEEKRPVLEDQAKQLLYGAAAPRITGKLDEAGAPLLPGTGELDALTIARAIGQRLTVLGRAPEHLSARLAQVEAVLAARGGSRQAALLKRIPYFCSGCPHNTSTRVPEGSRAAGGIGCHTMAIWMDRNTSGFTQMGGEGAQWVGMAPFTSIPHLFQNIGDGTYFHSGILAIRQAVAADVNITYKILFNGAVAMTGGQPVDGELTVPGIVQQLAAEGVRRIVVVSDDTEKYGDIRLPANVPVRHRDTLDSVQRELRGQSGVSVIVYDQTCAAEKRRRRKRGTMADPAKRVVINELVCEGCGDCSVQSNCLSVVPVETEFGTKRAIDQSSCNKDYSCVKGFCPSFVTVHGGTLRKRSGAARDAAFPALPEPALPAMRGGSYDIVITGIGGTGVVTIGALLGMAAHLEGRGVAVLDQTGLAQKGGAVTAHVRIAPPGGAARATHVADAGADLLLGCDLVVSADPAVLRLAARGRTKAVVNTHETVTAEFTRQSQVYRFPRTGLQDCIAQSVGAEACDTVDAGRLATSLLGDSIAANLFMLGYAWQKGLVPLSSEAIARAIELNGVSVEFNKSAFLWGRRAAQDPAAVEKAAAPAESAARERPAETLDEIVARRARFLTEYQNARYASRYTQLVQRVAGAEQVRARGRTGLAEAVARNLFKLMAYKDEYEVARLYTQSGFLERLDQMFEGAHRIEFHLAPPIMAARDPATGHLQKRAFGPWMRHVFRMLAAMRGLRGTVLDPFGRTEERQAERRLIGEYEALVGELLAKLDVENHALALELARIPDGIRGFGHIKMASLERARQRQAELLAAFRTPASVPVAAE